MSQLLPSVGRWSVLVAVAALVAACSDSTTTPPRNLSPSVSNADQWPELNSANAEKHIMHIKGWVDNNGNANGLDNGNAAGNAHGRPGGGGGTNGISYHGGSVLQSATNVVAVYWASSPIFTNGPAAGSGTAAQDNSLIGYFLANLGGSSYYNINTTYTDGSGKAIANVVNYNGYWANNTNVPVNGQNVSDAQIVAMLQSGFSSGALSYNASTLYAVFTAGTVNLGGGFGTQYCAYHTHGTVTIGGASRTVLYAAMPYNYAYPSACSENQAPNGDAGADAEVNTLAHEIEETTTDMMGNAWFDTRGYENADKCAWTFGSTSNNGQGLWNITVGSKQFLVQQNWVNAAGGYCAKTF